MRHHSARALTCDGLVVSTALSGAQSLGRHNTAPRTLEIDNSTSWVRVNMINIHG